jgi:hypothetical protein
VSAPAGQLPALHRRVPGRPGLPVSFVVGTVLFAIVAGLAGWVARSAVAPTPAAPTAPPRAIALGSVGLSVPGAWAPVRGPVGGLPELGHDTAVFAPVPGLTARAVVTLAPFDDETLVPAALRPLMGFGGPTRSALAGMRAWTYRPQGVAGGRLAQVTVAPTTAGSIAVVCMAPAGAWSGAAGCGEGLTSANLHGATPLVPSATLAFRRLLAPVIERLGARRAELRARLRSAPTRRGQARFAARLDGAHGRAAAALAPRAASGATHAVVVTLTRIARWYRRLSAAAANGWPVRYRRARAAVRRHDRALARTLARVR